MPDEIIVTTNTETPQQIDPPIPSNESAEQRYQRLYGGTPQTPQQAQDTQVVSTLQALQNEIASLKAQIPQSVAAPNRSTPAETQIDWINKIREGDFTGATASLKQSIQAELLPQIESARQQAYQDATAAGQVQLEMREYMNSVRSTNPDLLPFERYLTGPVNEGMQLAQNAGRIRSTTDFIREYKTVVDGEVTKLRNQVLQVRGAGKDEALSRQLDVTRSTTLNPQQVQSTQSQTTAQQNSQGESTDDYFARRKADEGRRRGLI